MKMQLKQSILTLAALLAFTACSNDSDSGSDLRTAVPLTVYGELAPTTTRVTYDETTGAGAFVKGDIIYVTKVKENIEYNMETIDGDYVNIPYQYDGSKFAPVSEDNTYYFDVASTADVKFIASNIPIYAWEDPSYTSMNPIDISDQTKSLVEEYIYASATAASVKSPTVSFQFKHCFTKVTLNFSSQITECVLTGVESTKAYPLYAGGFQSAESSDGVKCHLVKDGNGETTIAEAYLFPYYTNSLTVTVTSGGNLFCVTISDFNAFGGCQNTLNIDIQDKLVITSSSNDADNTGVTIEGYTEDGSESITPE